MPSDDEGRLPVEEASNSSESHMEEACGNCESHAIKAREVPIAFQNRELSWLAFNERVLDQSQDLSNPLIERLRFLSIYDSNLQEFFMVRVGSLLDLSLLKKSQIDSKSGMKPKEQLREIYRKCHELSTSFEECFSKIEKQLSEKRIIRVKPKGASPDQKEFLSEYFRSVVNPVLSPQVVLPNQPFPHLENGSVYVIARLCEKQRSKPKSSKKKKKESDHKPSTKPNTILGLIALPHSVSRIVRLPGEGFQYILLEHVIEAFLNDIYAMYDVKHKNAIRVTRNADLDVIEGAEEQGDDFRAHMRRILKKRSRLAPVRLESEKKLSSKVRSFLLDKLSLRMRALFTANTPVNLNYVNVLCDLIDAPCLELLSYDAFHPRWPSMLEKGKSIIDQVLDHDILISYPYETMDAFVSLLREAAFDQRVSSISISLYRLSENSRVAEALIEAASQGKEVTVLLELRARFDEQNNIEWSQRFERAGCHVIFGPKDRKVHAKICLIDLEYDDARESIVQLGTGNYNESTSTRYTDFSLITANDVFAKDAQLFFSKMNDIYAAECDSKEEHAIYTNIPRRDQDSRYEMIWVSPDQIRDNLVSKIDEQIVRQKDGLSSGIFIKANSMTDKSLMSKLIEASNAGVKCTLLIRGIACIVPGIEGITDNIEVCSIVGRFLEHSRIYAFGSLDASQAAQDNSIEVFLSSADIMNRNMDRRIEVAWPIINASLKARLLNYIRLSLNDTARLRKKLPNKKYSSISSTVHENECENMAKLFDSQGFFMENEL